MGRPAVNKKSMVRKLEPYLKMGLSVRKSCIKGGVARRTLTQNMAIDKRLRSKIESLQNYKSEHFGNISMARLEEINTNIKRAIKNKESIAMAMRTGDRKFLEFLAKYDRSIRREWGDKEIDPLPEDKESPFTFEAPKTEMEAELQERVLNKHYKYVAEQKKSRQSRESQS